MPFRVRVRSALQSYGSGLDWIDRRAIAIMHRSTDSLGAPLSLLIASVIAAIIKIPKKKTWSPNVKEKRKAGTGAGDEGCDRRRRHQADRERRRKWVQPAQASQGAGSRPDHDPFPFRRRRWSRL